VNNALMLGVLAGALQLAGYIAYNASFVKRGVRPNTASWFIWAFGSVASSWSYVTMSKGHAEDILPIVCSVSCILTFIHVLTRGERKKIDSHELLIIGIDILVVIFWIITSLVGFGEKAAIVANLMFQASTLLSFGPMIREVYKDGEAETKLPWILWSCAYAMEIAVLWVQHSVWNEWVYPIVCLPLHVIVAIFAKVRTTHA